MASQRKKMTGFSGPVFSTKDEAFRDTFEKDDMFIARETYRIPRAYWKVMVTKTSEQFECGCFLLDQYALEKTKKPFKLANHVVSLSHLEQETGLLFSANLRGLPSMDLENI